MRFAILFRDNVPGVDSSFRARRRSLNGLAGMCEWSEGGDGSWFGVVSMLCSARQVESRACAGFECDELGESGGDANRADCNRVIGVLAGSHVNALGRSMIASAVVVCMALWWSWSQDVG